MSRGNGRPNFGFRCPKGGRWYVCETGPRFVGCCKGNPCTLGCSDGNLAPASFNPAKYSGLTDQSCPSGSLWYTCAFTNPSFVGCCKSNPCARGSCPKTDLTAGFLSSNPALAAVFLGDDGPNTESIPGQRPKKFAAIVGGAVGGFVFLVLVISLVGFWYWHRRRRARRAALQSSSAATDPSSAPFGDKLSPGLTSMYSGDPSASPDPSRQSTQLSPYSPASHHFRQLSHELPADTGSASTYYGSPSASPDPSRHSAQVPPYSPVSHHVRGLSHELPAEPGLGLTSDGDHGHSSHQPLHSQSLDHSMGHASPDPSKEPAQGSPFSPAPQHRHHVSHELPAETGLGLTSTGDHGQSTHRS